MQGVSRLWREGGRTTASISISRCVLTSEINCREEGKDARRRREAAGGGREGPRGESSKRNRGGEKTKEWTAR